MNTQTIEKPYLITYSNNLIFEGKTLAFRKKELFDISGNMALHIKRSEQGWWIGRKLLSPSTAKALIIQIEKTIDVTHLQWYDQEKLNHVFNL
jgi:hypothetical protein